jgi:predicted PurR-regulated permease PerM
VTLSVTLAVKIYTTLFQAFENTDSLGDWTQKLQVFRDQILTWLQEHDILTSVDMHKHIDRMTNSALTYVRDMLLGLARDFLASTPEVILNFFIFILAFAAFLLMGSRAFVSTANVLGIEGNHNEQFARFEKVCALSLGSVLMTGLVQATIVVIGALICGLGNYFIIFAVTFIFSMIPVLGGGVLPFVLAVIMFFQGETSNGIVLLITSGIAGTSDNILKAWLFSKAAETNPAISLISLIGGIALFGFPGLFIAPTVEQLVMAEYHRRRQLQARGVLG